LRPHALFPGFVPPLSGFLDGGKPDDERLLLKRPFKIPLPS
jgi:hypothetical protein